MVEESPESSEDPTTANVRRAEPGLNAAWIEPDDTVEGLDARRRARLTSLFIIMLIPLGAASLSLMVVYPTHDSYESAVQLAVSFATVVLLGALYPISRKHGYQYAAYAAIVITTVSIWTLWYAGVDEDPADTTLYYLILPIFMSGIIIGSRATVVFGLANIFAILFVVPWRSPAAADSTMFVTLLFFVVVMAALMTAAARTRESDIRELETVKTELEGDKRKLREKEEQQRQMINNIVHDLGSPITPMKIQLALAGPDRPVTAKTLDILRRNLAQVERLVADLKDLSLMERGRLGLQLQDVEMKALLRGAVEAYAPEAQKRGVRLEMQDGVEARVVADPGRVTQMIYNLVTNALKFTPRGGNVTLTLESMEGTVSVKVRDSGRGLTPDEIARLFKPFSQVHDRGEIPERGTGLGLFICKGIAEAHGGRVSVESEGRGRGSAFIVTIPASDGRPPPR
ncbi:MAG: HAMP domain-containing histidine kinase [Euryarchaeota archaeon]|nr:HAMP domain-containing histidine kinase [Euryarchaeota archaeon]